jgi:hypothetical protein
MNKKIYNLFILFLNLPKLSNLNFVYLQIKLFTISTYTLFALNKTNIETLLYLLIVSKMLKVPILLIFKSRVEFEAD